MYDVINTLQLQLLIRYVVNSWFLQGNAGPEFPSTIRERSFLLTVLQDELDWLGSRMGLSFHWARDRCRMVWRWWRPACSRQRSRSSCFRSHRIFSICWWLSQSRCCSRSKSNQNFAVHIWILVLPIASVSSRAVIYRRFTRNCLSAHVHTFVLMHQRLVEQERLRGCDCDWRRKEVNRTSF